MDMWESQYVAEAQDKMAFDKCLTLSDILEDVEATGVVVRRVA